jgi:rRNA maturation protein Nop10
VERICYDCMEYTDLPWCEHCGEPTDEAEPCEVCGGSTSEMYSNVCNDCQSEMYE